MSVGRDIAGGIPQDVALALQLAATAGGRQRHLLEVRYRLRGRPGMGQFFKPAAEAKTLVPQLRRLGRDTDVYVAAAPRTEPRGGKASVREVNCLWADCDGQAAADALAAFPVPPSIVNLTGSGANCHALWALRTPLTPDDAERGNRRLAHRLGADPRSCDAARILRAPGTFNHKHDPPTPVECVRLELDVYDASEIVGGLPDPPTAGGNPTPPRALRSPDDPLATIPASIYVPALSGREVGRDGKVRCPFHARGEERTPSLHAYDDPAHGFMCFGCGKGGTVYDFAAALWNHGTRGADFHRLRERIAADLLRYHEAAA